MKYKKEFIRDTGVDFEKECFASLMDKYSDYLEILLERSYNSDSAKCECCGNKMKKTILWQCENEKCWEKE